MKRILSFVLFFSLLPLCCTSLEEASDRASLVLAAKDGNLPMVQSLLEKGVSPNVRDSEGVPALMWASEGGHIDIVKFLLDEGADVNAKRTKDGTTVLMETAEEGHTDVVKLLLERGAKVNVKRTKDGITALMEAADKCHADIIRLLLDKNAEVNAKTTDDGTTALMEASDEGCTETVKLLLDKGAKVNIQRTTNGTTALMEAAEGGRIEIVRLLLDKGADVNKKAIINYVEYTSIDFARNERHWDIVEMLEQAASKDTSETTTAQYDHIALSEIINLTNAQEIYYAMEATFCDSLEELEKNSEFEGEDLNISPEVTVIIEQADHYGYVMKTSHQKGKKIYMSRFNFSENIHDGGNPEISEIEGGEIKVLKGTMDRNQ